MRGEKLEVTTLLTEYNMLARWENSSVGENEMEGEKRKRTAKVGQFVSYLQDIRATGHRPTVMTLALLKLAGCFADSLVAFVPRRCSCSLAPSSFSSSRRARCFFCVLLPSCVSSTVFSPRLLPSSFSVSDLISTSPWSPAPVSTVCACSSFLSASPLLLPLDSLLSISFCLLSFLPLPLFPLPCFPHPYTLRPVVAFFWSLFPRIELVFLPARRQVRGWLENGENGRTGTRMRMRGWGGGALSLERSRRYVR